MTTDGHQSHRYLSTGCLHNRHDYCQSMTGYQGEKRPARCKFCPAECECPCHTGDVMAETSGHRAGVAPPPTPEQLLREGDELFLERHSDLAGEPTGFLRLTTETIGDPIWPLFATLGVAVVAVATYLWIMWP